MGRSWGVPNSRFPGRGLGFGSAIPSRRLFAGAAAVAAAWFVTGRGTPASLRPVTDGVVVAPVPPPLAGAAITVVSVHEVRLERAFPGWGLL